MVDGSIDEVQGRNAKLRMQRFDYCRVLSLECSLYNTRQNQKAAEILGLVNCCRSMKITCRRTRPAPRGRRALLIEKRLQGLFAKSETDEAGDSEGVAEFLAFGFEESGNLDVGVFDESLFEEAALGEKLANLALEDVLDDVRRLSFRNEAGAEDVEFVVHHGLRDVVAGKSLGRAGGDVEGEVLDELLEAVSACGFRLGGADFDQDADLATEVDVGGDDTTGGGIIADILAELEVFADFADLCFDRVFDGLLAVCVGEGGFVVSGLGSRERVGDFTDEGLEAFVFRDEVGFAVDFNEETGGGSAIDAGGDDAFVGGAVAHFGGFQDAPLAEELDGGFDVAVGFGEDFFAVHHWGVGFIAEFFDNCGGDHGKIGGW